MKPDEYRCYPELAALVDRMADGEVEVVDLLLTVAGTSCEIRAEVEKNLAPGAFDAWSSLAVRVHALAREAGQLHRAHQIALEARRREGAVKKP